MSRGKPEQVPSRWNRRELEPVLFSGGRTLPGKVNCRERWSLGESGLSGVRTHGRPTAQAHPGSRLVFEQLHKTAGRTGENQLFPARPLVGRCGVSVGRGRRFSLKLFCLRPGKLEVLFHFPAFDC